MNPIDFAFTNAQRTSIDRLKTRDHAKGGRFPASRWPDQYDELAIFDIKAECIDSGEPIVVGFGDFIERHRGHGNLCS